MAYIGNSPANVGNYQIVDDISSSFNGSLVTFALTTNSVAITPTKAGQVQISINGVLQEPDNTGTDGFKVSASNVVFSSAPASGDTFWAVYLGDAVDIGTPSDDVVDTAHIKDNAITADKIAAGAVVADIATGGISTAKIADDAVTEDKLANAINSAIAANTAKTGITSGQASAITANTAKTGITSGQASAIVANTAKVTNATHTGDVTGGTSLTIADDAVDIPMLSATGTAGNTTFLRGDNTWATAGSTSASDLTSGTLPMARLSGTLPALNGASLTSVNAVNTGRKNILINGDMGVAQRGTQTGVTGSQYLACDRWQMNMGDAGTWSYSQDTDVPAGQGFTHSLKMDCTTADAAVASGSYMRLQYRPESQDLKQLGWGTSNAQPLVMSFWIKFDNLTGDFCTDVLSLSNSNNRSVSQKFTYGSAGVWQKCVFTIPADTGGNILEVDNNGQTYFQWLFQVGSDLTSGTLNTDWATRVNANRAAGQTLQAGSNTSNNIYLTGCQLELGSVATDFEYRSYGEELALCQRYFEKSFADGVAPNNGANTTTQCTGATLIFPVVFWNGSGRRTFSPFAVSKRASPTITRWGNSQGYLSYMTVATTAPGAMTTHTFHVNNGISATTTGIYGTNNVSGSPIWGVHGGWTADAEL